MSGWTLEDTLLGPGLSRAADPGWTFACTFLGCGQEAQGLRVGPEAGLCVQPILLPLKRLRSHISPEHQGGTVGSPAPAARSVSGTVEEPARSGWGKRRSMGDMRFASPSSLGSFSGREDVLMGF